MGFSKSLAAACGLAAFANGHMLLATPARVTSPAATNGPLDASGSNFPCQLTSGATLSGESTSMALGSDQPMAFIGESVHGGGSCQVSITYDENPTSSSTWKVITSIEGGCPAQDTVGNLGSDTSATAPDPYAYNFTVPDDIPSGNAVLAWTWFNKVGNREMYMNCAMVELTGTSGDQSNYDALPDMFTANIDNGGCSTEADTDLVFPDPGDVVQKLNGATSAWGGVNGTACNTGSSAQATGTSSSEATTTAAASYATTTAAAVSETAAGGGIFASVGVSVGVSAPATTAAAVPTTTAAAAAATTAASSSSSGSSSSSSSSSSSESGTAGTACSDEGDYVCVDSTSYLVCASGLWTSMPIATGTSCSGTGNTFAIVASKVKMTRALRWARRGLPFLG